MASGRPLLGQILKEMGAVSDEQIQEALTHQYQSGSKIGQALVALGHTDTTQVARALARQSGLPFVNLDKGVIPSDVIASVPVEVAREHSVVPVKRTGNKLIVAFADPLVAFQLDHLRFVLGLEASGAIAEEESLRRALKKYYDVDPSANGPAAHASPAAAARAAAAAADEDEDAPIIRLVTQTVEDAVKQRASDIHVEPFADRVRIRFRIDGECQETAAHPKHLQGSLLSRIKIMAGMDIAEKRRPQDGRIAMTAMGREIDIRVSALPANHGESLVMRLLDRETGLVGLDKLGFHPDDYRRFKSIIRRPNGIFLVTGPTGSGKTTTLYAALQELNRPDVKIITAENPVEYHLNGVNQCEVRHKIGVDFAKILRAMLRQAPNIILIGEIRDRETADIAVQAALTGHLVFSTLHTNDAPSAITRLVDIGVKPFLVASAVQAILAQRLVRTVCPKCKTKAAPDPALLAASGLRPSEIQGRDFVHGVGCDHCRFTGYRGRIGIFELLEMESTIRELTFQRAPTLRLREQARLTGGLLTLREDGLRKALAGQTTLEEVLGATSGDLDTDGKGTA
jgi:type IV pilus assembly protein PilB